MAPAFKNLLVPIDFTPNSELAVAKAIDLADREESSICLLHVLRSKPSTINGHPEKLARLRHFKMMIEISVPGVTVHTHVIMARSVEQGIVGTAAGLSAELIIIARSSGKKLFSFWKQVSPASLAKKTFCAVLTLKPGSGNTRIKSIVIPFRAQIPRRKLDVLIHLVWKKGATIYLVGMMNELNDLQMGDSSATRTFIETYKLLKEEDNCHIVHRLVPGKNVARSILRFAQSVNADVIFASPDEMSISSLAGLDILDMLDRDSRMQLLTVGHER